MARPLRPVNHWQPADLRVMSGSPTVRRSAQSLRRAWKALPKSDSHWVSAISLASVAGPAQPLSGNERRNQSESGKRGRPGPNPSVSQRNQAGEDGRPCPTSCQAVIRQARPPSQAASARQSVQSVWQVWSLTGRLTVTSSATRTSYLVTQVTMTLILN